MMYRVITHNIPVHYYLIILIFSFLSCSEKSVSNSILSEKGVVYSEDIFPATVLGLRPNQVFVIDRTIDLQGKTLKIPSGVQLKFTKNGMLNNGCLKGNRTEISCNSVAFDKVRITGTWEVPEINSSWFKDLSYDNALKDVFALSNPSIKNKITIDKGNYQVTAKKSGDVCVPICSNTELIMNGTVHITPNDYKSYNIFQVQGDHVTVSGNGTIIGDKHSHIGTIGEWGMGINIRHSNDVCISGLNIKDCWGDCIYVGGGSTNVKIENCMLEHGRRQGITLTKANGVTIRNCKITNVGGTNPQCAIVIEPNELDSVDNVLIENITVRNCEGGFKVARKKIKNDAKTPWIGRVTIKNCNVSSLKRIPIMVIRCEDVVINKCTLIANSGRVAIQVKETDKAIIRDNHVTIDGSALAKAENGVKKLMGKETEDPIEINTVGKCIMKNNQIVER